MTNKIDERIKEVRDKLSKEILLDIEGSNTVAIISDGGNSSNLNKTKKNTLTISRVTENFCLKTDTVAVPVAKGSQEAVVIRTQWKQELDKVGLPVDCHISVTVLVTQV